MALQELVGEIDKASQAEEAKIMAEAEAEATQIIREANAQTHKIRGEEASRAQELCEAEERKLSSARLRGRQIIAQAKSEVITEALADLAQRLEKMASAKRGADKSEYERLFGKLAREAVKHVPSPAVIHCRKEDAQLAAKYGTVSKVYLNASGGFIASSTDGKVRVDNTFPAILEEKSDLLTQVAHQQLFSGRMESSPARIGKARKTTPAKPAPKKVVRSKKKGGPKRK
jgi:vacuolar-type H+-ATPase subunit E/Vma4